MAKRIILYSLGALLLILAAAVLLYQPFIRPWHLRFGATPAEVQAALPGDEIITGQVTQATRAIDVHAPAARTWPWLLQLGQGRGGLYSYDWLENLVGCDIHTLSVIVPDLQNLKVGDVIKIGNFDALPYYRVALIEPQRALVLRVVDAKTGLDGSSTWGFYLDEQSPALTRLVIRHRDVTALNSTGKVVNAIFEPISFVMEEKMLRGLRDHAEMLSQ
jgi:hypothetical protein